MSLDPQASSIRDEVVEAVARLASAIDGRDWVTVAAMMRPDVRAYSAEGTARVIDRMRAHLDGVGATQHLVGNHRVELRGDEVRCWSYGRIHHVGAGPMIGRFYECMGDYDDTWLRAESGWLLQRRTFDIRISLGDREVLRPR